MLMCNQIQVQANECCSLSTEYVCVCFFNHSCKVKNFTVFPLYVISKIVSLPLLSDSLFSLFLVRR